MSDRQVCTKDAPMPKDAPGSWVHPDAKVLFKEYGGLRCCGDYERYYCPHCDRRFWKLPDLRPGGGAGA